MRRERERAEKKLNTAYERLAFHSSFSPLSRIACDTAAGGVLIFFPQPHTVREAGKVISISPLLLFCDTIVIAFIGEIPSGGREVG